MFKFALVCDHYFGSSRNFALADNKKCPDVGVNLSCLSILDETDCKTSSTAITDVDKSDWSDNKLYIIIGK